MAMVTRVCRAAVISTTGPNMKLSRTVSYAVRATLQLAQNGSSAPVPCSKLALEGEMPERFLLQILRVLVTHGILKSTRGVEGGYSLSRSPEAISLLEVIEAIDGPLATTGEPLAAEQPVDVQQMLQTALRQVTNTACKQLEAIKLSQLLPPPTLDPASPSNKPSPDP
jgi:Rrf2 family protein